MKIRILAVGDIHAKASNVQEQRLLRERLDTIVVEERPDCIVLLGDIHDSFEKVHESALTETVSTVKTLSEHAPVHILMGNHDAINASIFLSERHTLNAFKHFDNVSVIDRVLTLRDGIIAVPYTYPGRFKEALDTYPEWREEKLIFAHQEFRGVKMGAIESKHGDLWDESLPLVVSGHIHEKQWLQKNIYYTGAPLYHAHGGPKDEKTVALVTIDGDKIDIKEMPVGVGKKVTMKLNVADLGEVEFEEGADYRLNIMATVEEYAAFKKTKLYRTLNAKYKLVPDLTNTAVAKKNAERKNYLQLLIDSAEKSGVRQALDDALAEKKDA